MRKKPMSAIVKIAVDLSLDREFDYLVPDSLVPRARIGARVIVPFGHSSRSGYIVGLADRSAYANLKSVISVAEGDPLLDADILKLAEWMADYYCSTREQAIRTVLPGAVRKTGRGFKEMLRIRLVANHAETKLTDAQSRILARLKELPDGELVRDLLKQLNVGASSVKSLEKKGLVSVTREASMRDPFADLAIVPTEPLKLTCEQDAALAVIRKSIESLSPPVVLVHGVTGSGKTEIYLQAIAFCLSLGKGAITLVPEISLTPQAIERFRGRFGDKVAVLHSHLSDGERHDEWHRIKRGEASIVVGARSAIFAPVRNPGLIMVDEEHDASYKQDEAPRYNARDVAVMRGRMAGCPVVLGSATPSLESRNNVRLEKYAAVVLEHRVDHRRMPDIRIVDMRMDAEREGRVNIFSRELIDAVRLRLERAEQTMLFLNRRGYASALVCPKCGNVENCDNCSVSLTYHRQTEDMKCHLCGTISRVPPRCPKCGDPAFKYAGMGTQRIEIVAEKLFPTAAIRRMDSDVTGPKHSHRTILGDFKTGKIDILIGTQMISKGLDFPNVTLIGVIAADMSLYMPDFRAGERTYQLLTQVSGRAGRGEIPGEVIVQTYTPFHPAVQAACHGDAVRFYEQEIESRRELNYPPFAHLVCIVAKGMQEDLVMCSLKTFAGKLRSMLPGETVFKGPAPAPIARIKGMYRGQLLVCLRSAVTVSRALKELSKTFKWPPKVSCSFDVDALSLL